MLKRAIAAMSLWLPPVGAAAAGARINVPEAFGEGALRIDLRHQRVDGADQFALRRLRFENSWGARRQPPHGNLDWGDYRLSLYDDRGAVLFRTGFDSTVERAARAAATAALSVRCPMPQQPMRAAIEKRRLPDVFQELWTSTLDPHDRAIDRSRRAISGRVEALFASGAPSAKVDIALLGDGYTANEFSKFNADAARAADYLFSVDPFRRRRNDFNVSSVFVPSPESGITDPYLGTRKNTPLGCAYLAGESERTIAVRHLDAMHEAASAVAYDFVLVLANARRYGGSAIFGGPAVVAIDSGAAAYLVLHEFAHVIGGLADEYYIPMADGPAYAGNVEPWNPNVTISPGSGKWAARASAPLVHPAAWNKSEYERYFSSYVRRYYSLRTAHAPERAVESLMREARIRTRTLLAKNAPVRKVAWFEGANGYAKGAFRSEVDCIMFSLQTDHFCSACSHAIESMIDEHCT